MEGTMTKITQSFQSEVRMTTNSNFMISFLVTQKKRLMTMRTLGPSPRPHLLMREGRRTHPPVSPQLQRRQCNLSSQKRMLA